MIQRASIGLLLCGVCFVDACGGEPASGDTVQTRDEAGGGESVTASTADETGAEEVAAEDSEDDGSRCLPVSHCHSFANQSCALVGANGEIQTESAANGDVREACPGQRGIAESVVECFDYIEITEDCRRPPDLRSPEWPCGPTETSPCDVLM